MLAKKQYLDRHNFVGRHLHWQICKKYDIATTESWYKHAPGEIMLSRDENVVVYWDSPILTERKVGANRPDIVIHKKAEREWIMVDPNGSQS